MDKNNFDELLHLLAVKFKDQKILKQAFIHRSYLNEVSLTIPSNERLEFLGDAILSFIVSNHLYSLRAQDNEGKLTNLRAYIVKTKSLSEAAKKLNLGKYLKMSKGEEIGGGRQNPQLLANTYEALLGAIYLDQGLETVRHIISKTLLPLFADEIRTGPPQDAKSKLQEFVQEKLKESPHYKTLQTQGPDHAKQFVVGVYIKGKEYGRGVGSSKQEAEEKAAQKALKELTH